MQYPETDGFPSFDRCRYLTVNYERSNFSVSQSVFPEAAQQRLTPILPPSGNLTTAAQPQPPAHSKKLSTGAVAGIVVAVVTLCILAFGTIFFIRRRRHRSENEPGLSRPNDQVELDGISKPAEADSAAWKPGVEMEGNNVAIGLDGIPRNVGEFPGSNVEFEVEGSRGGVEMEGGGHPAAVELDAGPIPIRGIPSPKSTKRKESIPSGPGTPLISPESGNSRSPHSTLGNARLQSLGSADVISSLSSSTHPNPALNPRDVSFPTAEVPRRG